MLVYKPRVFWTLPGLFGGLLGPEVDPELKTEVFIHHTAGGPRTFSDGSRFLLAIRRLSAARPDLKETDIPYNFVAGIVEDDLWIVEGQGARRRGEAVRNRNTITISIAFMGNWDDDENARLADGDLNDFARFLRGLRDSDQYGGPLPNLGKPPILADPLDRDVWFHRDTQNTRCPGIGLVESFRGFRWIDSPKQVLPPFDLWWFGQDASASETRAMRHYEQMKQAFEAGAEWARRTKANS